MNDKQMLLDKEVYPKSCLKLLQKCKPWFSQNCFRVSFVVRYIPVSKFKIKLNILCKEVRTVSTYSFTDSLLTKKLGAWDIYVNTHTEIRVSSYTW